MISTITSQNKQALQQSNSTADVEMNDDRLDGIDDRSSSLSDPDDGLDEHTHVEMVPSDHALDQEVDSEAETERLEKTPQKLAAQRQKEVEKTPSKLAQQLMLSVDSPEPADTNDTTATASIENATSPSRKRKRASSEPSSLSDLDDRVAPKRSQSVEQHPDGGIEIQVDNADPSSRPSSERDQDNDNHAVITEAENETTQEGAEEHTPMDESSVMPTKRVGRRKKGKGHHASKKDKGALVPRSWTDMAATEEPNYGSDTGAQDQSNQPDGEDLDEEETPSFEENNKKKTGLDVFGGAENSYNSFHGEWLKQQLSNTNAELDLLQGDHPTHPEYLAQMRCIDKRSDEKVHYENVLLEFEKKALRTRTVAERCTHHSQFFQEVREIKDKALETCWKEYFALQKDRRSWGADTSDYTMLYNPSRSVQIHQQRARNLEVSILSGIAKHVGFPGVPVMKGLSAAEVEQDLSMMGTRKNTVPFTNPTSFLSVENPDGAIADVQFLQQNPWANPQHPAHAHAAYTTLHGPAPAADLVTPAKQIPTTNPSATNGSQSTVELASNPPSASVPGPSSDRPRESSDSPISTMKAIPGLPGAQKSSEPERISTTHTSSNPTQAMSSFATQSAIPRKASPFGSYPMGLGTLEKAGGSKLAA